MAEKAFALRVQPELKTAAKALTGVYFSEWAEDGSQTIRNVNPSSINEALAYLIRTGAGRAAQLIEHDLNEARQAVDFWEGVAKFFLDNPTATHVVAEDFPEGSEMRSMVEASDAASVDSGDLPGWHRQEAFSQLAIVQRAFTTRSEAKAALLKAAA